MDRDQRRDRNRQQKHVGDVHPRPEVGGAGERAAPDQLGDVRADERDRERDPIADRESHSRKQIVDERIAEIAFEQPQDEDREAHVIRQLPRLSKCTGKDDPHQVNCDRGDEDISRPVMRLTH